LVHPQLPGVQGLTAGGAALACLLLFGIPARRRKWRAMLGMVALLAVLVGGIVACGGGSGSTSNNNPSNPGTTAGSYTVTVTGTDTATGKIAASTSVNLTVN
jgi:multidrug efflux pump subunit AcrA (membrane-fusion protein)